MSQSFMGAQPKVVKGKTKFNEEPTLEEDRTALNIMHDKRVHRGNTHNVNMIKQNLTPAQKEELRIKEEREKKKVEMIRQQLILFKTAKKKPSPYDLRPGTPARIEVDLTYFLTEQNNDRPQESDVKVQTDEFIEKPPTPPYVPKKTGIDKITQIEDYDLFDYDREVQPILNVLLTKTVEQSILEVEEEAELEEIHKYQSEWDQRRDAERADWKQEVKKEITRIKQKNKAVRNALVKREQQRNTMLKVQALNISKQYLSGVLMSSMRYLKEHQYWRDSFKDQLRTNYHEWLFAKVDEEFLKKQRAGTFQDELADSQMNSIGQEQIPRKKQVEQDLKKKEKIRQIESQKERTIHFTFNTTVPKKETPFSRRYKLMQELSTEELEAKLNEERENFAGYLERFESETLEEGESNPVVFSDNTFPSFSLHKVQKLAFATADNPFYKPERCKYHPEVLVMSTEGEIVAKMNGETKEGDFEALGLRFLNDFRDQKLKMNDDKKVRFDLSKIKREDLMIFMFVRTFDLSSAPPKEGEFDRAMFRLLNEETNQTIDYKLIKKIELPEGFEEDVPVEAEEGEEAPPRKCASYFGGRIFKEGEAWIYESYGHVFTSDQHPDLAASLSKMYKETGEEYKQQEDQLKQAKEALVQKQEEEEKRNAARAAAQAKKNKKSKKGEPAEVHEEEKKVEKEEEKRKALDLNLPKDFREAILEQVPNNFIFGPVTFKNLDNGDFCEKKAREAVLEALNKQIPKDLFIHGFKVLIKGRTLHRATTIQKHSRFLANLSVEPIFPPEPEPVAPANDEEGEHEQEEDE